MSNSLGVEGEVGIAVNPLNPLNIVAVSNNNDDLTRMATYVSDDGGNTWTTVFIDEIQDGLNTNDTRFDPNVAFDSDGNAYVVYSVNTGATSILMLARSTDGGSTYTQVTQVTTDPANSNLHTAMVTTRADPTGADDVLVLWARVVPDEFIQAGLSLDGGASFLTFNNDINEGPERTFVPWAVVDDAGDFHIVWEVNLAGLAPDGRIFHDVLDGTTLADGANVTVTDIQITDFAQATSKLPAQPDRGVFSVATVDIDRSGGPNDGRIYISYTDRANTATDDTDIFVRFSDDGGATWSAAVQINDDVGTTSQFMPRLAVDQTTGDVYAAWYDARNDATNNQLVDIFTSFSVDGGVTWEANTLLTTAQSNKSTTNPLRDGNNYTEYMGLVAFGGAAFVGWTDARALNFTTGNNEEIFFGRVSRDDAVVTVFGDEGFINQDDVITITLDASGTLVLIFENDPDMSDPPAFSGALAAIDQINVFGFGGNDTLIVDSSNGLIDIVNGIRYDGGSGFDELQLLQTDGDTQTSDTYSVGPEVGSGVSTIVGASGTQTVFFQDLSPVLDLVPAALLTVNATAEDNAISYTAGSVAANGLVAIDEHEPIEFSKKAALTINAGAGQDTISLNNSSTPDDLTGITINGGDSSGGDALIVTGGTGSDDVAVYPQCL